MSASKSAAQPHHDALSERMNFELDEGTTDMVRRLADILGIRAIDVIAKAIANEAFIVSETRNGRHFQLRDNNKVAPVKFV